MNQRELKQSIEEDPNLTDSEKARKLNALCEPYTKMSDEELLQLVRDFTMEYGREPMRKDVLYDRELKKRFGPWTRMLEKAGTRPVAEHYLEGKKRRREKRARHKEYRRQLREQQAAEAARLAEAAEQNECTAEERQLFGTSLKKKSFSACRYGRQLPETFTKESGILT